MRPIVWSALVLSSALAASVVRADEHRIEGDAKALKVFDNLANAARIARDWRADAVLVRINAHGVREDGTVDVSDPHERRRCIYYRFFSAAEFRRTRSHEESRRMVLLQCNRVNVLPDTTIRDEQALPSELLDSDRVWASAREAGAAGTAEMYVTANPGEPEHPVAWRFSDGTLFCLIDAKNGELLKVGVPDPPVMPESP